LPELQQHQLVKWVIPEFIHPTFVTIVNVLFQASKTEEVSDEQGLASIDIGDSLPSFILKNEKGEDVDVSALAAERGVVFFLVPRADTCKIRAQLPTAPHEHLTEFLIQLGVQRKHAVSAISTPISHSIISMCIA
jgi:hypothetical protein